MSEPYAKDFFAELRAGSMRSAEEIVPLVLQLVPARSMVDVGCGEGAWAAAFKKNGVLDVLGIDGDYVDRNTLQIPSDQFRAADLSKPLQVGRTFDIALSLEVAEHLPPECAASFVESLTHLAPVVFFSAAIPFQGGTHHINEQWPEKWADLFKLHGYLPLDCIRSQVWKNDAVQWWYAQNVLLFVRADLLESNAVLKAEFERTSSGQLSLVHPRNYVHAFQPIDPPPWNTRTAWGLFLLCLRNAIRRRLHRVSGGKSSSKGLQNPPDFNSLHPDGTSYAMVKGRNRG